MQHFEPEEWIDFVRDVAVPGRKAMEEHLRSGCRRCGRTVAQFRALVEFAAAERRDAVPEAAVHRARGIGAGMLDLSWSGRRFPGELLLDTLLAPALEGVRAGAAGTPDRQLLYQAGHYTLDLREIREPGSPLTSLIGQVADGRNPDRAMEGVTVSVLSGKSVLARAETNLFGEFQLEWRPRRRVTLLIAFQDGTAVLGYSPNTARAGAGDNQDRP